MKTLSLLLLAAVFGACTTAPAPTVADTRASVSPADRDRFISKRTYTREDIRKTGRTDAGSALETLDPSVRVSGR